MVYFDGIQRLPARLHIYACIFSLQQERSTLVRSMPDLLLPLHRRRMVLCAVRYGYVSLRSRLARRQE